MIIPLTLTLTLAPDPIAQTPTLTSQDRLKNVSLGTSKINYNDPRITVAWCKRHDVPIHKPFPKTLLSKFSWAMAIEPDFKF